MSRGIVVAGLLALLALSTAGTAHAGADPADRLVGELNEVRSGHGLAPLGTAPTLLASASRHARSMLRTDRFAHARIDAGGGYRHVGEALAMHRGARPAPHRTLRALLASPAHRALLLSRRFNRIGLGHAHGRLAGMPSTVWVVRLGRH